MDRNLSMNDTGTPNRPSSTSMNRSQTPGLSSRNTSATSQQISVTNLSGNGSRGQFTPHTALSPNRSFDGTIRSTTDPLGIQYPVTSTPVYQSSFDNHRNSFLDSSQGVRFMALPLTDY